MGMSDKELKRRYKRSKFKQLPLLGKIAHCLFVYRNKITKWEKIDENKYKVEYKDCFNLFNPLTYLVLLVMLIYSLKDDIIDFVSDIKSTTYTSEVTVNKLKNN